MSDKKIRTGKLKYGSVSALMLAMVLIALTALNVGAYTLEKKKGWSVDLSFNGILSQSAETKAVLEQLEDSVEIYALIRKSNENEPALSQLMELLDRYAAASDKITWKQTDPALNPTLLNRFTTDSVMPQENNLIVWCEKTGRFRMVSGQDLMVQELDMETGEYTYSILTYENAVTSAIAYVIRDRVPQAVILQGHNEYDPDTLVNFQELLEANQYTVIYQNLKSSDYIPDPEDLLIFFCPTKDLTEAERSKLTDFAMKGGSFLFVCEYDACREQHKNQGNECLFSFFHNFFSCKLFYSCCGGGWIEYHCPPVSCHQNNPEMTPLSSTSMFSAEGAFGNPGMSTMSPANATTNPAPL